MNATITSADKRTSVSPSLTTPVVTLVRVKAPWYAPNFLIASRFRGAVSTYEQINGLERKLYTLGTDRYFGGLYLWKDQQAAEAWFTPDWRATVQKRYGTAADLRLWQAPVILSGGANLSKQPLTERSFSTTATVTLMLFQPRNRPTEALDMLHNAWTKSDALVWTTLLHGDDGRVGRADVWQSRHAAQTFLKSNPAVPAVLGSPTQEIFSVPVGMDERAI